MAGQVGGWGVRRGVPYPYKAKRSCSFVKLPRASHLHAAPMRYRAPRPLLHGAAYGAPAVVYPAPALTTTTAPPTSRASVRAAAARVKAVEHKLPVYNSTAPASTVAPPTTPSTGTHASVLPAAARAEAVEKKVLFYPSTAPASTAAPPTSPSMDRHASVPAAVTRVEAVENKKLLVGVAQEGTVPAVDAAQRMDLAPPAPLHAVMIREEIYLVYASDDNNISHCYVVAIPESMSRQTNWNFLDELIKLQGRTFGQRGDTFGQNGYYHILPLTQMGLSLNIDVTSFFKPVTTIKFVEEFLKISDASQPLSGRNHVKVNNALQVVCIETSYQQDQIRLYKITGTTPILMDQLMRLTNGSWPCPQSDCDSGPVYLPLEVCKVLEGQWNSNMLNERQLLTLTEKCIKHSQERGICDKMVDGGVMDSWKHLEFSRSCLIHMCHAAGTDVNMEPFEIKSASINYLHWRPKKIEINMPKMTCRPRRAAKKLYVRLGRTLRNCTSKEPHWRSFLPSVPEVTICRPIEVMHFHRLDHILATGLDLFDHVPLDANLRDPNHAHNFASFLNAFSRYVIHGMLVSVCREGHEIRGVCWGGAFQLSDILISEGHIRISSNVPYQNYTPEGGRLDYEQLHKLIFEAFVDPATNEHPCHLAELFDLLRLCPERLHRRHDFVTFLINHPCVLSYAERIKIYFLLDRMIRKLNAADKHRLNNILNLAQYAGWSAKIMGVPELMAAYYHEAGLDAQYQPISKYGPGLGPAFNMIRNFLNHTSPNVQSLIAAEAAVAAFLPFVLPMVVLALLLRFTGPIDWDLVGIIANKNSDRCEAEFTWEWQ